MANSILDRAYAIDEEDGVAACRVVVQGEGQGYAKLPADANAGAILGVTTHAQSRRLASVAVRKAGIARVVAAGAIAFGEPVNVAGASGKVKAIDEDPGTLIQCLGFAETGATADGDIVEVMLSLHERTVPTPPEP